MDSIHLMTVFIVVGEEECLAAAARRLDLSPAAVRRAVSALEAHLNVALLSRMTRSVVLTEAGRLHLQVSKQIISSLAAADRAVRAANAECRGRLSVAAPVEFGRTFVLPCLAEYMHRFPALDVTASFCGAEGGITVRLRPRISVTTTEAAIEAAGHGLGVARVLSHQAAGPVAEGRLRIVLDRHGELPRPVYVLRRDRYRDVPKVSQFVNMLVEQLRCELTLQLQRASPGRGRPRQQAAAC